MPYLATVRKIKVNAAAASLARKRWEGSTAESRREQLRKAWAARSANAKARREAQAAEEPEGASA